MDKTSESPLSNAQGGQQDTNREQPQGAYQQGQSTDQQGPAQSTSPSTQGQEPGQKVQPPLSNAQGGEQDTNRGQPQGGYQQGSSQ
jgi:hypothetical protein